MLRGLSRSPIQSAFARDKLISFAGSASLWAFSHNAGEPRIRLLIEDLRAEWRRKLEADPEWR
jgi:hypothetical protein